MNTSPDTSPRQMLTGFYQEALNFLQARSEEKRLEQQEERERMRPSGGSKGWSEETLAESRNLAKQARTTMAAVAASVANSLLITSVDKQILRECTGMMDAAVRGLRYEFQNEYVEDGHHVAASERDLPAWDIPSVVADLKRAYEQTNRVLDLVPSPLPSTTQPSAYNLHVPQYRPNTAFLMMRISEDMNDTLDAVVEVFGKFDIVATRADLIEHEGVITSRILEEISLSEFLFADLSGERPSVYYEVGYAHALGKRVILYRKAGTPMHFDLVVHNCPEYSSLRDLKEKLTRRLSIITGRDETTLS